MKAFDCGSWRWFLAAAFFVMLLSTMSLSVRAGNDGSKPDGNGSPSALCASNCPGEGTPTKSVHRATYGHLSVMQTPAPATVFSVTVAVAPSATGLSVGDQLTATVTITDQSEGCQYPVYDLTLSQEGENALFDPASPVTVGPPVASSTVFTLTALNPGTVVLKASAYGEKNCGHGWQWHYVHGQSEPITVDNRALPAPHMYLPFLFKE